MPYICFVSEIKIETQSGEALNVDFQSESNVLLNGKAIEIEPIKIAANKYHILKDDKSYLVEVVEADYTTKSFQLKVNNQLINLTAEDKFDMLLNKLGMDKLADVGALDLKAPMPGLVLSIAVAVGDEIQKDDALVILEAMKMENVLKATSEGKVKSIAVKQGEAVEKNQILIEFE